MRVDLFDFDLPEERIALRPARPRDAARLLVVKPGEGLDDRHVRDLPDLLAPGDVLVLNDTKVIPAELRGERLRGDSATRGRGDAVRARRPVALAGLARPGTAASRRRPPPLRRAGGQRLPRRRARRDGRGQGRGGRGAAPLRPRGAGPRRGDRRHRPYAAAALHRRPAGRGRRPTAPTTRRSSRRRRARSRRRPPGCISPRRCSRGSRRRAIETRTVTLHVGPGTFLPVKADDTGGHRMHAEWGDGLRRHRRGAQPGARPRAGGSSPSARRRSASSKSAAARTGRSVLCRRDIDLHHAGLPLPRGRPADDQFPPAALDAVHAGLGLLRAGDDARRLQATRSRRAIGSIPTATRACSSRRRRDDPRRRPSPSTRPTARRAPAS